LLQTMDLKNQFEMIEGIDSS